MDIAVVGEGAGAHQAGLVASATSLCWGLGRCAFRRVESGAGSAAKIPKKDKKHRRSKRRRSTYGSHDPTPTPHDYYICYIRGLQQLFRVKCVGDN